jgi:hypothetical protein
MKIHVNIDRIVVDADILSRQGVAGFQQQLEESLQAQLLGRSSTPGAAPIGGEAQRVQALSPQALGQEIAQRVYQEIADDIG